MRFSQFLLQGALCLAAFAGVLSAQQQLVALVPGLQGTSTSAPLYTADQLTTSTSLNSLPPGVFQILPKPDGSKYYIVSNNPGTGLLVINQNLTGVPTPIATAINAAPTYAALSPDGKRLLVVAGSLVYLIDTVTDNLVGTISGYSVTGGPVYDASDRSIPAGVAFSQDSQTAYILSNGVFTAYVTPIDLRTFILGARLSISLAGTATGIATGPNGLIYVSAPSGLFEINPQTLQITPGSSSTTEATIPVNGTPTRVQFTSDARYALALDKSGNAAYVFDLVAHTVVTASAGILGGVPLSKLLVASDNRIFVYSSTNQTLYELSLGGVISATPLSTSLPAGAQVQSIAVSNEVQGQSLYVLATANGATNLYRFDLSSNNLVTQSAVTVQSGQTIAYVGLTPTSGANTLLGFNTTQTLASGTTSLPLVARVLDAQGRPVFGATVSFQVANGNLTLNAPSANTDAQGFAQIYATAGTNPSGAAVTATVAGISNSLTFGLTISTAGSGGGGTGGGGTGGGGTGGGPCLQNCGSTGITLVSGNGQFISEQAIAPQLMLVLVKDSSGKPAAGVPVIFTITQGNGTIACPSVGDTFPYMPTGSCKPNADPSTQVVNGLIVDTDATGQAGVKYVSTTNFSQSFTQTYVNAAANGGSVNFIITTILVFRNNGGQASLPVAYVITPQPETSGTLNGYRVIRGSAGQTIKGAIKVQVVAADGPQAGQPIPNIALNVSAFGDPNSVPSATCAGGTQLTDAAGMVSCDLVLGPVVSANPNSPTPINVNLGNAIQTSLISVVVSQGQASQVKVVQGDKQSGKAGQQFTLIGKVTDPAGNPVASVPVTWKVTQGTATLTSSSAQSDAQGNVQTGVTLGGTPGNVVVQVTATPAGGTGAITASFNLTITVTVGGISSVSGSTQSAVLNQAFGAPLVVLVTDSSGKALANTPVTFAVTGGAATLGSAAATTDAQGHASTTVTAGSSAGAITVIATAGTQTAQFTLTSRVPGPAVTAASFVNGASGQPGLTPCGIAIVSGSGLAPGLQGTVQADSFVGGLPFTLSGDSLTVNGIAAPIFWVSNTQAGGEALAFQTPCDVTPGPATVILTVNGSATTVASVPVTKYQPGIFQTTINGKKYAVLVHVADGSYVTPDNPAHRGEQLLVFVTGLGTGTPSTATNRAGVTGQTSDANIIVGVNNAGVRVIGSQYLPGAIGIYTITFEVPSDTATGTYQNLGLIVTDPADPNNTAIYAYGSFLPIS